MSATRKRKYTPDAAVIPQQIAPELWTEVYRFLTWKDLWTLHFVCRFFFSSIATTVRQRQGQFIIFRKHHDFVTSPYFPRHWPLHISFERKIQRRQLNNITQQVDVNVKRFTFLDFPPPANADAYKDVEIVLVDSARFPVKDVDAVAFQGAKRVCFVHDTEPQERNTHTWIQARNSHNMRTWKLPARMPCLFNNTRWNGDWYLTDVCDLTIHTVQHGDNSFHIDRIQVPATEPLHVTIIVHAIVLGQATFLRSGIDFYFTWAIPVVLHFKFTDTFEYETHFIPTIAFAWRPPSSVTLQWPRGVSRAVAPFVRVGHLFCDLQWLED